MEKVTCGIVIFNSQNKILACHPTRSPWNVWSVPKGLFDESDGTYENTAKRELREETGITLLDEFVLYDTNKLYKYSTKREKYFKGFWCEFNIDVAELRCYSYVTSFKLNSPFPEVDAFTWINYTDIKILHPTQQNFIKSIKRI